MVCSICQHDQREAIDRALVAGVATRTIAHQFRTSRDAIVRHKATHVSPAMVAVQAERQREGARSLVEELVDLVRLAKEQLAKAERSGNIHQALAGIREVRATLEVLGKATGELRGDTPSVSVNVLQSPEVQQLIVLLRTEFADQPDRLAHVAARLALVDGSMA